MDDATQAVGPYCDLLVPHAARNMLRNALMGITDEDGVCGTWMLNDG
jgi:hypothetical protein